DYILASCQPAAVAIGASEESEYTMLDWDDRMELMRRGTEMVAGRAPVVLGISHPAPERAVELAEHAQRAGADVAHLLLPMRLWGGEPDPDELYDYVDEVAIRSPLPVCVANNRGPGADPGIPSYTRLAELFNVAWILETSGDVTKLMRLAEEIDHRGLARCFTTVESLLINLTMGGSGAAMPPPATFIGGQVVRALDAGDTARAIEWQRILGVFHHRWSRYGTTPVMKAAMRHLGIDLGRPLPPYAPVSRWDEAAIGQFLEEVGLKEPGEDSPPPAPGTLGPARLQTDLLGLRISR